jgi:hypothetical protein
MQTDEDGQKRFQLARDKAVGEIRALSADATIDLYLTAPELKPTNTVSFDREKVVAAVDVLRAQDVADSSADLGADLTRIADERGYDRVLFFTDRPIHGRSNRIKTFTIGRPRDNLALTEFKIGRSFHGSRGLKAVVEVTSFSSRDTAATLVVKSGGRILSRQALSVPAGQATSITIESLPFHPFYEASIDETGDSLTVDNRRFAVAPQGSFEILAVSPRPEAVQSLNAIPGVKIRTANPEDYARAVEKETSFEIFHFSAPSILPEKNALFVLPPETNSLVKVGGAVFEPEITKWLDSHRVTTYVNFRLVRPRYARSIRPLLPGEPLFGSRDGPLALAIEKDGFRYLVLGFDPLPYLGQKNLPISILTLNAFEWLADRRDASSLTGQPMRLATTTGQATIFTPDGEPHEIQEPFFYNTLFQGIYEIADKGVRRRVAVNLDGSSESDLRRPKAIRLQDGRRTAGDWPLFVLLQPYLLLLAIVLLLIEWLLSRRELIDYVSSRPVQRAAPNEVG